MPQRGGRARHQDALRPTRRLIDDVAPELRCSHRQPQKIDRIDAGEASNQKTDIAAGFRNPAPAIAVAQHKTR